jgi:hypothetical protein
LLELNASKAGFELGKKFKATIKESYSKQSLMAMSSQSQFYTSSCHFEQAPDVRDFPATFSLRYIGDQAVIQLVKDLVISADANTAFFQSGQQVSQVDASQPSCSVQITGAGHGQETKITQGTQFVVHGSNYYVGKNDSDHLSLDIKSDIYGGVLDCLEHVADAGLTAGDFERITGEGVFRLIMSPAQTRLRDNEVPDNYALRYFEKGTKLEFPEGLELTPSAIGTSFQGPDGAVCSFRHEGGSGDSMQPLAKGAVLEIASIETSQQFPEDAAAAPLYAVTFGFVPQAGAPESLICTKPRAAFFRIDLLKQTFKKPLRVVQP